MAAFERVGAPVRRKRGETHPRTASGLTQQASFFAHRDIKPQNLLLDTDGHLLLTDFGSAAPLLPASSSSSSSSSPSSPFAIARKHCRALIGTPDYIAPEILAHAEALYLEEEEEEDSDDEGGGGLGIKSASGAAVAAAAAAESKDELAAYGAEVDLWSSGIVMYEVGPFHFRLTVSRFVTRSSEFGVFAALVRRRTFLRSRDPRDVRSHRQVAGKDQQCSLVQFPQAQS